MSSKKVDRYLLYGSLLFNFVLLILLAFPFIRERFPIMREPRVKAIDAIIDVGNVSPNMKGESTIRFVNHSTSDQYIIPYAYTYGGAFVDHDPAILMPGATASMVVAWKVDRELSVGAEFSGKFLFKTTDGQVISVEIIGRRKN